MGFPMLTWFRSLAGPRLVAAILITVVTVAVIGGVIVSSTTIACGPAKGAGLKLQQCRPVAARISPSPIGFPSPITHSPLGPPSQPYSPPGSQPYYPPASQPYYPPASNPYPPQGQPATAGSYPPFTGPASGTPPFPLNCRLPVYAGGSGSGGFIVFPGGNYIADPASAVTLPFNLPTPPQGGEGPGFGGLSYDAPLAKWLPVQHSWVSPDGRHYVYPLTNSIYVIDASSKAYTEVGKGHQWSIVGVTDEAVLGQISGVAGLWKITFSGTETELTAAGFWQAASTIAAYGTETSAVPQGATTTIIRFDLASGQINNRFFSRDGSTSTVVGFDGSGNPIIQVYYFGQNGGFEVWVATTGGATAIIGSGEENASVLGTPIGDANGVWMWISAGWGYSVQGIALYIPGTAVVWMASLGANLAGGCS